MPRFNNYVLDQLIAPAFDVFFFIGGLTALLIGIGLVVKSPTVFRLFDVMNYSVSARNATKALEVHHDSSRFLFKHRIVLGSIFVVGALYADYGLLTGAGNATIVTLFNTTLPPGYVFWIVESLRYFLMVSCTVSIIVGVLMIVAPDTLKSFENTSRRLVSTDDLVVRADMMNMAFDKWVTTYPRTAGLIITFPALGMVSYFWDQLLRRM